MKKLLALLLALMMSSGVMAVDVWDGTSSPWVNGGGTADDPYLIETAAHLAYLAEKVNEGYQAAGMEVFTGVYFLMTDDMDLDNLSWTPIGNADMNMQGYYFGGVFDGWYHNIDHLRIQSNADAVALFAALGGEGVIQRLSVTNGNITATGTGVSGIVCGLGGHSMVYQCSFSGTLTITNNGSYCGGGGIVGAAMAQSKIIECSFHGSITSTNNGGFMGAAGAGGIIGAAMDDASIQSCFNTGAVHANAMMLSVVAGILGTTLQDNNVSVCNCYNVGTLDALTKGGVFGMVSPINPFKGETSIEVANCYYLNSCGGNNSYGTSKSADEMRSEPFKDLLDQHTHTFVMGDSLNDGYPMHSLLAMAVNQASDLSFNSARLSAVIHQGNDSIVSARFAYHPWDSIDWVEVEIPTDGYVEVLLDSLEPDIDYEFCLQLLFADSVMMESPRCWFHTLVYDAVASSSCEVLVYPNPVTDVVYIQGVNAIETRLFNVSGQLVKKVFGTNEMDVTMLIPGVYLLSVTDDRGGIVFTPLVVTR